MVEARASGTAQDQRAITTPSGATTVIRTMPFPRLAPCPGPLVWFTVPSAPGRPASAVLECATCREIVTTGNFMNAAHLRTPVLRSPR